MQKSRIIVSFPFRPTKFSILFVLKFFFSSQHFTESRKKIKEIEVKKLRNSLGFPLNRLNRDI